MESLCELLKNTHLSSEINNISNDGIIDILTESFNNLSINNDIHNLINKDDIIDIVNKSNNLSDFCLFMINIITNRYGKRCYQNEIISLPFIL